MLETVPTDYHRNSSPSKSLQRRSGTASGNKGTWLEPIPFDPLANYPPRSDMVSQKPAKSTFLSPTGETKIHRACQNLERRILLEVLHT